MNTILSDVLTTIYLNMDEIEISASIFGFGDVIYAKKSRIKSGDGTSVSIQAVDLLQQTIERAPPSLLPAIRERGIVVSGSAIPAGICDVLQQNINIHAALLEAATDAQALSVCLTWLKGRDI